MKKLLLPFICILPFIAGCAHQIKAKKLLGLSIGMNKQQVLGYLGEPNVVRGSMTNSSGQVIETWEYWVTREQTEEQYTAAILLTILTLGICFPLLFCDGTPEAFWIFFHDEKLVKFCKAGDWETTQHNIQEIRFR